MDALSNALSGMQSASARVATSAHNVANLLTEDFRPQRAVQESKKGGGSSVRVRTSDSAKPVQLEREIIDQMQASTQYTASARVVSVASEMRGSLLDLFG
ncbi:MAG: flagellar basal body rod C-terminal domain-containing protein [Myxococcota bacterium]